MATNLKGQGGAKGFLLLHGEKIAIGVVGAIALWFVYKSTSLPKLDDKHQAPQLQSEIQKTSAEISQFTWDQAKALPGKALLAVPIPAKNDMNVKPDDYVNGDPKAKSGIALDTAIVKPVVLRTDPPLLNAVAVRATGGSGLLSFADQAIRDEQLRKKQAEDQQQAKKDEEKRKKDEAKQKEGSGGTHGKNPKTGPGGAIASEVVDPAHPKRRRIEGSVRPAGIPLQGGERIERAYWACVVAKVPIREQLKLFQDALEKARGYDSARDFPHYLGYQVERAEVLPGKDLEWKRVPLYDAQRKSVIANNSLTNAPNHTITSIVIQKLTEAAQQFWAGVAPDIVDPRFEDPVLTVPFAHLPPLVGRDWGPEVCHPDIPLNPPPLDTDVPTPATVPEKPAAGDEFGTTGPASPAGPGPGYPVARMPGGPGNFARGPGLEARMYGPGSASRFQGPGPGRGPEGARSPYAGPGAASGQQAGLPPKGVDYWLLRFFDYTVEPGKKYKYRVRLVLADPNADQLPAVLAQAVQDRLGKLPRDKAGQKPTYRFIEKFSDPSPTVVIPLSGNVRLADTKIPSTGKINDEPSTTLLVEAFDADSKGNAIQAAVEKKDVRRGHVVNTVEDTEYIVPEEGGTMIDTQPGFKFLTGMTLLDIDGGTQLTKDMTSPARILVMGPAGEMYIHNEIDDKPLVDYHRALFEKTGKGRGPGPGPGGSEMGPPPGHGIKVKKKNP